MTELFHLQICDVIDIQIELRCLFRYIIWHVLQLCMAASNDSTRANTFPRTIMLFQTAFISRAYKIVENMTNGFHSATIARQDIQSALVSVLISNRLFSDFIGLSSIGSVKINFN